MQKTIETSRRVLSLEKIPLLMGIVNITPDSFSDGGEFFDKNAAIEQAIALEEQGADIIDIGGESSRPGSEPVSEASEISRVVPVIRKLSGLLNTPISIDTTKSTVAEAAIKEGAEIINDISGLRFDPQMARIAEKYNTAVIVMHMLGTPKTMQENIHYDSLIDDLKKYFRERIKYLASAGIKKNKIVLDPGIGFGKTVEDNLNILKNIKEFKNLGYPVLIGASRKSFIGKILNCEVTDRYEGTLAVDAFTTLEGVDIIRTHNIKATKRIIQMINAITNVPAEV